MAWAARGQSDQAGGDQQLGQQHPPATTTKSPEQRGIDTVDHGRPEELERVGETDPREESDRLKRGSYIAKPVAKRVTGQKEGQPGRETKHEHDGDFGLSQRLEHVALGSGLYLGVSHASS